MKTKIIQHVFLLTTAIAIASVPPLNAKELTDKEKLQKDLYQDSNAKEARELHRYRSLMRDGIASSSAGESGPMQGMTAEHNKARTAIGQNIPPLVWDSKLATYAAEWAQVQAKNCAAMSHRPNSLYGENIAGGSGIAKAADAFSLWMKEKKNFNPNTKQCSGGNCGHYTQIIWKNTQRLGCAMAACDCSVPGNCWGSNSTIWVCNYDPPGNYYGQTPY